MAEHYPATTDFKVPPGHTYAGGYGYDDIVSVMRMRMADRTPLVQQMQAILDRYRGDYVIPYPDLPDAPLMPNLAPGLIGSTIDGHARRASSVKPAMFFPALYDQKEKGRGSRQWATTRRRAMGATLHKTGFASVYRRMFRQISAYNTTTLLVRPDPQRQVVIETASPLSTYPEPKQPEDLSPLANCGFVKAVSCDTIRRKWPRACEEMGGILRGGDGGGEMWHVLEWWDEEYLTVGILGQAWPGEYKSWAQAGWPQGYQELAHVENLAGRCPVVVPKGFTLDEMASAIGSKLGTVDLVNRLLTLDIISQEKEIFPDRYIIGSPNGSPAIVGGTWQDGRTGRVNILTDVTDVGVIKSDVGGRTGQLRGELEESFRSSVGLAPMMTGQGVPNMRTGRAQETVLGASVDPIIQEMHELAELALPQIADLAFATYEGYWPDRQFSMYSGWQGTKGMVTFTPNKELAETHQCSFNYAIAGADVQGTTIELGQLRGLRAISLRTLRERHPHIDDAETEADLIDEEDMEEAGKQAVIMGVVNQQMHPAFAAKVEEFRKAPGTDILQAIVKAYEWEAEEKAKAQQEAQAQMAQALEQAGGAPGAAAGGPPTGPPTAVPTPTPQGAPPMVGPGGAMEGGLPTNEGPGPSQANMRQLLMSLRAGSQMSDSAVS